MPETDFDVAEGNGPTEDSEDVAIDDFGFSMDDADEPDDDDTATSDSDEEAMGEPKKRPAGDSTDTVDANAVKAELLKHVNGETVIKIKGVERRIRDLSPEEIVNNFQKIGRADQLFNEVAASRKQVDDERRRLENERARMEREFAQSRDGEKRGQERPLPDFLRPNEFDTPEVTTLKRTAAEMQERLERLEGNFSQSKQAEQVNGVVSEIRNLSRDYPMASVDEVIAVKLTHPDVSSEDLLRMAHTYYSSPEHIDKAFESNPTYKREYTEKVIRQYLAQKNSAKKIAGQPKTAGSSSPRVSEKGKIPIRDFKDADVAARAFLGEMRRGN